MQRLISCLLVLALIAGLSGCTGGTISGGDPNNLLTPPRLTGDQSAIEDALERSIGESYKLKYPLGGQNRSAYILKDLDGDGQDEAVVFYQLTIKDGDAGPIRMCVLDSEDGKWMVMNAANEITFPELGTDIDSATFATLDTGNSPCIIVGVAFAGLPAKQLLVYRYDGKKVTLDPYFEKISFQYSVMEILDLDGDGTDELFAVSLLLPEAANRLDFSLAGEEPVPNKSVYSMASLISFRSGTAKLIGNAQVDATVASYSMVRKGILRTGIRAVYLDGIKGTGEMITEVLYWDGISLQNLFYDKLADGTFITARQTRMVSMDIDNNGAVEIPETREAPGYQNKAVEEKLWIFDWYRYDGRKDENGLIKEQVFSCVMNTTEGYYWIIPDELKGKITYKRDVVNRIGQYYWYSGDSGIDSLVEMSSGPLFEVRAFTQKGWELEKNTQDYIEVGRGASSVIGIRFYEDNFPKLFEEKGVKEYEAIVLNNLKMIR